MKKYVLIDKVTGKYFPNTSDLQEADVFDRQDFNISNATFIAIEVEYLTSIKLMTHFNTEDFVLISQFSGKYISKIGLDFVTEKLQDAKVFNSSEHEVTPLSLPVKIEKTIKIT